MHKNEWQLKKDYILLRINKLNKKEKRFSKFTAIKIRKKEFTKK